MQKFASRNSRNSTDHFYNIKADLPDLPQPPLHPGEKRPINKEDLLPLFPEGFIEHEISMEREVPIPQKVLDVLGMYRPTPLIYADKLKEYLDTPAHIFFKYEGAGPTGSHKSNTAIVQAYLAAEEGVKRMSTETGAGQWGSALSMACSSFNIDLSVFMVRVSYRQKPGRRIMMEMFGADVFESPGPRTDVGRKFFAQDPDHPGSLGIAISEAIEVAVKDEGTKYSLGSVLDSVLLHQTVIGQEAQKQMIEFGMEPDIVIGCVGGGSNFAGLSFPFIGKNIRENGNTMFYAVEPKVCPTLTKGELKYDFGDSSGMTPLLHMHTLGMDFVPPPIHAGGLRYHGMAPLVSHLQNRGYVDPVSFSEPDVFKAARVFLRTEGILPAPESAHAIAKVIEEADKARLENREKVILFNLSGHGFFDINAYEKNGH